MKLDIRIDVSMEIMHVFFFCWYVENSGCYGTKESENMANLTHKLDPRSTENIFMKLEIWVDGSLEIMHIFFSSNIENSGCYGNK
jgi:hypothetical protein